MKLVEKAAHVGLQGAHLRYLRVRLVCGLHHDHFKHVCQCTTGKSPTLDTNMSVHENERCVCSRKRSFTNCSIM